MNAGAPITVFESDHRRRLRAVRQPPRRSVRAGSRAWAGAATLPTSSPRPPARSPPSRSTTGDAGRHPGPDRGRESRDFQARHPHASPACSRAGVQWRRWRPPGPVRARGPGLVDRACTAPACATLTRRARWTLPAPGLPGPHQIDNAGIAVAAIRAARLGISRLRRAWPRRQWPARLQRLHGTVGRPRPRITSYGWMAATTLAGRRGACGACWPAWDGPTHLIIGMKQSKDTAEFLRPLLPHAASLWAVAEPEQHSGAAGRRYRGCIGRHGAARPNRCGKH